MIYRILLIVLVALPLYADSLFLGPSFYYTNGSYSNQNESRSLAFYNLMQLNSRFTLLMHYDNLDISHTGWKFKQQGFAGGVIADYFPFYFKLNYGHYKGEYLDDYSTPEHSYNHSQASSIYNFDFFYLNNWSYLGASYSFIEGDAPEILKNHQLILRFDKFISPGIFISVKPAASVLQSGNTLFSTAIKLHYFPSDYFIIKAGGFAGERKYFFDPDLILFFNQDDIQKYQVFTQLEYILTKNIAFITAYSHTGFNSFEINYFVAGIRTGFWF